MFNYFSNYFFDLLFSVGTNTSTVLDVIFILLSGIQIDKSNCMYTKCITIFFVSDQIIVAFNCKMCQYPLLEKFRKSQNDSSIF